MNVTRSIVYGVVGPRLSQISFRPLPKCCEQLQSPVTSFLNPRQRKLKVAAIRFLADEALANVQRLLEKGAGLLALAEAKQEIAHVVVGDGEVAQEVGAIGFLAGEALANVHRFITIAANRATGTGAAESQSLRTYELDLDGGRPQPLGPDDFTGSDAALT